MVGWKQFPYAYTCGVCHKPGKAASPTRKYHKKCRRLKKNTDRIALRHAKRTKNSNGETLAGGFDLLSPPPGISPELPPQEEVNAERRSEGGGGPAEGYPQVPADAEPGVPQQSGVSPVTQEEAADPGVGGQEVPRGRRIYTSPSGLMYLADAQPAYEMRDCEVCGETYATGIDGFVCPHCEGV